MGKCCFRENALENKFFSSKSKTEKPVFALSLFRLTDDFLTCWHVFCYLII